MTTPNDRRNGRREGERRKIRAHDLFAATRAELLLNGRRALLCLLLNHDTATADDVRALVEIPAGVNPTCLGAVPGMLARAGIIRRVGYAPSERPEAHTRPVGVWTLADTLAAIQWLRENPEPAEVCGHAGAA